MKTGLTIVAAVVVVGIASTSRAQDPTKVDPAHYKTIVDNPSVRVLRITYPAGAKSKMHEHPDSMVVVLSSGKMSFTTSDGKTEERELPADSAMFTPAGTHLPSNLGTKPMDAILVEFKSPQPGTATIPTERPDMQIKTLAESPRATAYRATIDPKFAEPAGTKHDYDQVVIALAPTQTSLKVEGQPAKTSWKRGDVMFIGRGVAHESSNPTGKPSDVVIVAIK
ncbi:MAG TPA: cupin domain-containing protein [Vicinamibacterales bacterium]|nr:cupin domain-containing protein [Vicinamibacterales bacterium]